jgi:hypothetical protein
MRKQSMFPLLATVVLLAAGFAHTQIGPTGVKANIPFDFSVGNTALPAGEYTVRATGMEGVVAVIGSDSQLKLVATHSVLSGRAPNQTKLVFHQYGDRYFLAQIWVEGETSGREVPTTRLEKELMSKAGAEPAVVVAHK